jgi:pimeloyl-ACP methyl ester carboxylesterase
MPEVIETPTLRIAYEARGPADGPPVLLLHGWPDDASTYAEVAPHLHAQGFRTIAPWLRGFGETSFRSRDTMRSGEIVAMAQDALDLLDALKIKQCAVVGHDWGARIAYALAICFPERVSKIVAMSVGWSPGELATPDLEQTRLYWYQWFMATARGSEAVHRDGKAFARIMWDTWAPEGWYSEDEFARTAKSFENPDWADVTVHSYTVRWGEAKKDPRYAELDRRAYSAQTISVPALTIHGAADTVTLAAATAKKDKYFPAGYRREVLDGVGHFPTREAPDKVAALIIDFLK